MYYNSWYVGFILLTSCWLPAVIPKCVGYIHGHTYTHMERAWGWGRGDRLNQRFFCQHIWYHVYDVLYLACLCDGSQGGKGLIRTKQMKTPDHISIYIISMCVAYVHGHTHTHTERAWGWGRSDRLSVIFVYISGMMCMMCCTWHVFVVAFKAEKVSSAQNRGGLPTIYICILYIHECSRSRTKVWKKLQLTPGTWCRVWFFYTYMWYLVRDT